MSSLQETVSCVTGASVNTAQIVVIVLLVVLVALHVATTILSARAAKSAAESAKNTENAERHEKEKEQSKRLLWPTTSGSAGDADAGACATRCGEACTGSRDIPILETCARQCAYACGFHLV